MYQGFWTKRKEIWSKQCICYRDITQICSDVGMILFQQYVNRFFIYLPDDSAVNNVLVNDDMHNTTHHAETKFRKLYSKPTILKLNFINVASSQFT